MCCEGCKDKVNPVDPAGIRNPNVADPNVWSELQGTVWTFCPRSTGIVYSLAASPGVLTYVYGPLSGPTDTNPKAAKSSASVALLTMPGCWSFYATVPGSSPVKEEYKFVPCPPEVMNLLLQLEGKVVGNDVNVVKWAGALLAAGLGLNDVAGDERSIAGLVRAGVTGRDLAAAAGVRNVPISSDVGTSIPNRALAVIQALYTASLVTGFDVANAIAVQINARSNSTAGQNSKFNRSAHSLRVAAQKPVADLCVSATAVAGAGVTATLPAPGASLRQFITRIQIVKFFAAAGAAGATPDLVTTTGLVATPTFSFPTAGAIGTVSEQNIEPDSPLECSADNASATIVCPAVANVIWRVNVFYYVG